MEFHNEILRSIISSNIVHIRLKNLRSRYIDIIWVNFNGDYELYKRLGYRDFVDITTYETHPWIAMDSETKDRVLVDNNFVYMPVNWREFCKKRYPHLPIDSIPEHGTAPRLLVTVTTPMYSLRYRTLLEVRSHLKSESDVDLLDIPKVLSKDLKLLVEERNRLSVNNEYIR